MSDQPSFINNPNVKPKRSRWVHPITLGTLGLIGILGTYFSQNISGPTYLLQTDLINLELALPFDGTSYPIKKVPNWALLKDKERDLNFDQLDTVKLIDLPTYQPAKLILAATDYKFGTPEYNDIINQQITYSIPYLGKYDLGHIEGAGSHPGIDIKIPFNTPIHAVANGVVLRAVTSDGGFGNFVTIGHTNVPGLEDINAKITIYSTYAHLNRFIVKEGNIIKKGQLIAYSGESGIATTPHLHLQIDTIDAPFKPYWPFTAAEAKNAGLSFFEAVNQGLGKDNAIQYTINPLKYIQQYLSETENQPVGSQETPPESINNDTKVPTESTSDNTTEIETPSNWPAANFSGFKILSDEFYIANNPILISIKTVTDQSEIVADPIINGEISLAATPEIYQVTKSTLLAKDFENGEAIIGLKASKSGTLVISLKYNEKIFTSEPITILGTISAPTTLKIESDGEFLIDTPEAILIKSIDEKGEIASDTGSLEPINLEVINGIGSLDQTNLNSASFLNGIARVTLTGEALSDIQIQAQNSRFNVTSATIKAKIFQDIPADHPLSQSLLTLKKRNISNGYPDGSFRPDQEVSRVEALKLILKAANTDLKSQIPLKFPDTQNQVWYSDYVATAQKLDIIEGYPDGTFRPTAGVSRSEFFKILFRTFQIQIDPVVNEKPYEDVGILEWYASLAQLVKKFNLLTVTENRFDPAQAMTRIEIAEAIYRLIYIRENKLDRYSE